MKLFLILSILFAQVQAATPEEKIGLLPASILGSRAAAAFTEVKWSADSEWFSKPAPVCRASRKPMDLSKFHEQAKLNGMAPAWETYAERDYGKREDGAFFYRDANPNPDRSTHLVSVGSPLKRKFYFSLVTYDHFERDEHQKPIVKPLPSKEQSVVIAREWMKKLGIDENELYRHGDGPEGFDVVFRIDLVSAYAYGTTTETDYDYGITLNFAQQIGGLPVLWHGTGGTLTCEIVDGGEFCAMYGTLSGWEKIGDYPVLNREEVTKALKEKFFWVDEPFQCESVEIVKVELEAYHARDFETQKTFPLIYTFDCKLHGGRDDGEATSIQIPALVQHRDRYGAPPATVNLEPANEGKPAVIIPQK